VAAIKGREPERIGRRPQAKKIRSGTKTRTNCRESRTKKKWTKALWDETEEVFPWRQAGRKERNATIFGCGLTRRGDGTQRFPPWWGVCLSEDGAHRQQEPFEIPLKGEMKEEKGELY